MQSKPDWKYLHRILAKEIFSVNLFVDDYNLQGAMFYLYQMVALQAKFKYEVSVPNSVVNWDSV
jgi:hypothetical protein